MVREFLIQEGLYLPVNELATGAVPPSAVNPLTVVAYMNRVGQGPSQEHPLFSWEDPVSHPWNVAVIRVLGQKFRTYVLESGLSKLIQLLGPSASTNPSLPDLNKVLDETGDIQKIITEKLEYQQAKIRRTRRKMNALQGHTNAEIEDALKHELSATRIRARRQERKRNVGSWWHPILFIEIDFSYSFAALLSLMNRCAARTQGYGSRSTSFSLISLKRKCPPTRQKLRKALGHPNCFEEFVSCG